MSLVILLWSWLAPPPSPYVHFPPEQGRYRVVGLRAIDGDTAEVGLVVPVRVRLAGVDAPELSEPEGARAREFLREFLQGGELFLEIRGRDKYGRVLGELVRDQRRATEELLRAGLARPYPER